MAMLKIFDIRLLVVHSQMLIMFNIGEYEVPFHEKSAWVMSFALLFGGVIYFGMVASLSVELGLLVPPNLPVVAIYTVILVIVAIIGHSLIAVFAPKDADAPLDERERRIFDRAGQLSGYTFATGVLSSLALYLFSYDGNLLFYAVFGSLMLGQTAEYMVQIFLFRTAV